LSGSKSFYYFISISSSFNFQSIMTPSKGFHEIFTLLTTSLPLAQTLSLYIYILFLCCGRNGIQDPR
jgi:hypothetical protein